MTQTRLFAKEFPARPSRRSDEVVKRAAALLLPDVNEWLGEDADDRVLGHLVEAIDNGGEDGYELAKTLERRGYSPDADLVEVLDRVGQCRYQAHKEVQTDWVKAHDLRLDLAVGSAVALELDGKAHTGEIIAHHDSTAEYTVFVAALGHVRKGNGTLGRVVGFERVTAVLLCPS